MFFLTDSAGIHSARYAKLQKAKMNLVLARREPAPCGVFVYIKQSGIDTTRCASVAKKKKKKIK